MSIPEELQELIESTLRAVREEADGIYHDQGEDVKKADLHYLIHEKLELALGRVEMSEVEKAELRREVGRPLHLLVERGRV